MENTKKTYFCDFGTCSIALSFDINDIVNSAEPMRALNFQWNGKPDESITANYVKWMHTVIQDVAIISKKKILYIAPLKPPIMFQYDGNGECTEVSMKDLV